MYAINKKTFLNVMGFLNSVTKDDMETFVIKGLTCDDGESSVIHVIRLNCVSCPKSCLIKA
jgi:hypothetical protein